jgi:hypothetical protein
MADSVNEEHFLFVVFDEDARVLLSKALQSSVVRG